MHYVYQGKSLDKLPDEPRPPSVHIVPGVCSGGCLANIPRRQQLILSIKPYISHFERLEAEEWLARFFKED